MLVIDIGGGSTEFVIGSDLQPLTTESLPLGCVTYSMRFFQNKVTAKDFQAAVSAARIEIQRISKLMKRTGWDFAIGTSGFGKIHTRRFGGRIAARSRHYRPRYALSCR